MSYNYLFDTYKFISTQLENAQKELCNDEIDEKTKQFTAGRINALFDIERFISKNFEQNLPHRLRNKLSRK